MTTSFIANARMYAVSPDAEAAWRQLIAHVAEDAGTSFTYLPYPAPQPLEHLWRRADVGCVQMCGYPIATAIADVVPLASPIPAVTWAKGEAVYRTDLIVRADAPYETLEDSFGGTIGWTVAHSHSGFNAPRHHLLAYRSGDRPKLYRRSIGNLITARRVLDHVLDGTIDIGPLDAYWHELIRTFRPEMAKGVRTLDYTATAPMPAFVAAPSLPAEVADRLRQAFSAAASRPWFAQFADLLSIEGFAPVAHATFQGIVDWEHAAKAEGYQEPA